ncbi:hypothetical protein HDU92_003082 [Lobulomyces angularis]|nr:hypothetical protein HDU92_003082 [Lobulomyces angularis]
MQVHQCTAFEARDERMTIHKEETSDDTLLDKNLLGRSTKTMNKVQTEIFSFMKLFNNDSFISDLDDKIFEKRKLIDNLIQTTSVNELNNELWGESNTTLHLASYAGDVEIIENLLTKGASTSIKNRYGLTPVDVAADEETRTVFRNFDLLKNNKNIKPKTQNQKKTISTKISNVESFLLKETKILDLTLPNKKEDLTKSTNSLDKKLMYSSLSSNPFISNDKKTLVPVNRSLKNSSFFFQNDFTKSKTVSSKSIFTKFDQNLVVENDDNLKKSKLFYNTFSSSATLTKNNAWSEKRSLDFTDPRKNIVSNFQKKKEKVGAVERDEWGYFSETLNNPKTDVKDSVLTFSCVSPAQSILDTYSGPCNGVNEDAIVEGKPLVALIKSETQNKFDTLEKKNEVVEEKKKEIQPESKYQKKYEMNELKSGGNKQQEEEKKNFIFDEIGYKASDIIKNFEKSLPTKEGGSLRNFSISKSKKTTQSILKKSTYENPEKPIWARSDVLTPSCLTKKIKNETVEFPVNALIWERTDVTKVKLIPTTAEKSTNSLDLYDQPDVKREKTIQNSFNSVKKNDEMLEFQVAVEVEVTNVDNPSSFDDLTKKYPEDLETCPQLESELKSVPITEIIEDVQKVDVSSDMNNEEEVLKSSKGSSSDSVSTLLDFTGSPNYLENQPFPQSSLTKKNIVLLDSLRQESFSSFNEIPKIGSLFDEGDYWFEKILENSTDIATECSETNNKNGPLQTSVAPPKVDILDKDEDDEGVEEDETDLKTKKNVNDSVNAYHYFPVLGGGKFQVDDCELEEPADKKFYVNNADCLEHKNNIYDFKIDLKSNDQTLENKKKSSWDSQFQKKTFITKSGIAKGHKSEDSTGIVIAQVEKFFLADNIKLEKDQVIDIYYKSEGNNSLICQGIQLLEKNRFVAVNTDFTFEKFEDTTLEFEIILKEDEEFDQSQANGGTTQQKKKESSSQKNLKSKLSVKKFLVGGINKLKTNLTNLTESSSQENIVADDTSSIGSSYEDDPQQLFLSSSSKLNKLTKKNSKKKSPSQQFDDIVQKSHLRGSGKMDLNLVEKKILKDFNFEINYKNLNHSTDELNEKKVEDFSSFGKINLKLIYIPYSNYIEKSLLPTSIYECEQAIHRSNRLNKVWMEGFLTMNNVKGYYKLIGKDLLEYDVETKSVQKNQYNLTLLDIIEGPKEIDLVMQDLCQLESEKQDIKIFYFEEKNKTKDNLLDSEENNDETHLNSFCLEFRVGENLSFFSTSYLDCLEWLLAFCKLFVFLNKDDAVDWLMD